MAILIKGIEMPKSCGVCPLEQIYGRDGEVAKCPLTEQLFSSYLVSETRMADCPLVELPPHGDLIDRNTAYDSILYGMAMTGYQSRALDCISEYSVPTIIESEGEE